MNVNHPCWASLDAQYRPSDSFYDAVLLALGLDSKLPQVPLPFETIDTENV